jgi:TIR domain/SMP-30/Gluconolactonase/LRE-like region
MGDASPTTAGRIFISYRREDTAYSAGWLYDRLAGHFGGSQIFKDIDSIDLGDDFAEVITNAVATCDVLLALVGDQWLTITDEEGKRRLDDPADFVRLEIEAALTRDVRVIPVLVHGATMPRAEELPTSLAKLVRRQALELSPERFEFDTDKLFRVLDTTLAGMQATHATDDVNNAEHKHSTEGDEALQHGEPSTKVTRRSDEHADATNLHRRLLRRKRPWAVAAAALALALVATTVTLWLGGGDDGSIETGPVAGGLARAPVGIAVSADGGVYVAESTANRVIVIDDRILTSNLAAGGNSDASDYGDGGPATSATFAEPRGVAVSRDGDLYIADRYHAMVRVVTKEDGTIGRFAGTGQTGSTGDDGPASQARLTEPNGVAVGPDGSVYIADSEASRVRRVDTNGTITTVAGTGVAGFSGDGGPATEARLSWPSGIAVALDPDGTLHIADTNNNRIRRVDTDGTITTVAGNGEEGSHGDGGPATKASLTAPQGIAFAPDGTLYIADTGNDRVRRMAPNGTITTVLPPT